MSCTGVSVVYGDGDAAVRALDYIDIAIGPGERVALWGRSGSGKTTLLHVLGGLVVPTSGSVWWRDLQLSSLDARARGHARAQGIAYIFQGANLLPHFTAHENVAFAARVAGHVEDGRHTPPELLALVGLAGKLDALPGELSGGEAQRVAIARALAQQPQLLLCDEPTGHLDSDTGARVLDLIEALQQDFGFALVTATHDADVAARSARAAQMHDGRIVGEERSG
ncbi:MAG TPA: ABC transporter ATP-binding protein [Solirubrobacteraceae bacterium]|nr:ABC transporter ATP-binding protein [Solirubrobacteraceae bacterium]